MRSNKPADAKPVEPSGETIPSAKTWKVVWKVEKYRGDLKPTQIAKAKPYEVVIREDNGLCNAGITALLNLLAGTGTYNAFNGANSYIRVGSGNTAFAASQTDLQGVSKTAQAVDGGYPSISGQTITWRATFGPSSANHAWEEVGVSNGASIAGNVVLLNRKVTSFGTKASGSTWTMTLAITIS